MFKKMLMIGISAFMAFTFGACQNGEPSAERNTDIDYESMVLIAYFSWSGNTKQLAEMIQEQTGGELFEIEPETPYTDDINELSGISLQEQRDNIRPALSSAAPDMSQYDVIFVGFPNWLAYHNLIQCTQG